MMRSVTYIFIDADASWKQAQFRLRGLNECSTVLWFCMSYRMPSWPHYRYSSAILTWVRKLALALPIKIRHTAPAHSQSERMGLCPALCDLPHQRPGYLICRVAMAGASVNLRACKPCVAVSVRMSFCPRLRNCFYTKECAAAISAFRDDRDEPGGSSLGYFSRAVR
jgi:hypothetical protein